MNLKKTKGFAIWYFLALTFCIVLGMAIGPATSNANYLQDNFISMEPVAETTSIPPPFTYIEVADKNSPYTEVDITVQNIEDDNIVLDADDGLDHLVSQIIDDNSISIDTEDTNITVQPLEESSAVIHLHDATFNVHTSNDDIFDIVGNMHAIENPYIVDWHNPFSLQQVFENNGLTFDRIERIQLSVAPDFGSVTVTDSADILSAWEVLSTQQLTAQGARQAAINEMTSISVDIQFVNPNEHVSIEMFGQVHILGHGPFVFTECSSERYFVDVFNKFISR